MFAATGSPVSPLMSGAEPPAILAAYLHGGAPRRLLEIPFVFESLAVGGCEIFGSPDDPIFHAFCVSVLKGSFAFFEVFLRDLCG